MCHGLPCLLCFSQLFFLLHYIQFKRPSLNHLLPSSPSLFLRFDSLFLLLALVIVFSCCILWTSLPLFDVKVACVGVGVRVLIIVRIEAISICLPPFFFSRSFVLSLSRCFFFSPISESRIPYPLHPIPNFPLPPVSSLFFSTTNYTSTHTRINKRIELVQLLCLTSFRPIQ